MITLKCKNCAGEMSIDAKGELACPYCGSKLHLSDIEYQEYKNFRQNLLQYLKTISDQNAEAADDSFLWNHYHDNVVYYAANGARVSIDYMFFSEEDNVRLYVAKNSVIYVFPAEQKSRISKMKAGLSMLDYPSADIKNLSKYFPVIKSVIDLENGETLVAIAKPENVYPLFAFGSLKPEHVAWIVSRMENFCCVFEFSEMVHEGISLNSVFINPRTHEAFLYGNWWKARRKINVFDKKDLYDLRKVAGMLMGEYKEKAPKEFRKFIEDRPAADAYSDFELWDTVIERGFGGHRFTKFSNE